VNQLTRRGFLAAAALAAIGGGGVLYRVRASDDFNPDLEQTAQAARLLGEVAPAQRLGRAYLAEHPNEASEQTLVRLLAADDVWGDTTAVFSANARRAVRQDFDSGRTVLVQGWVLSRTEARLCALTTFG
jgi:hypothetical protein